MRCATSAPITTGACGSTGPACGSCGTTFGDPPRRPRATEPSTPSLGELLEEITEERARGRVRYEVEDAPWPTRPAEPPRSGFPIAGCLVRIVGLVFLLIAAAIIFLFLLFGGFIVT